MLWYCCGWQGVLHLQKHIHVLTLLRRQPKWGAPFGRILLDYFPRNCLMMSLWQVNCPDLTLCYPRAELSAARLGSFVFIWNIFGLISKRSHQLISMKQHPPSKKHTRGFSGHWQALNQFPASGAASTPTLPFNPLHSRLTRLSRQQKLIIADSSQFEYMASLLLF